MTQLPTLEHVPPKAEVAAVPFVVKPTAGAVNDGFRVPEVVAVQPQMAPIAPATVKLSPVSMPSTPAPIAPQIPRSATFHSHANQSRPMFSTNTPAPQAVFNATVSNNSVPTTHLVVQPVAPLQSINTPATVASNNAVVQDTHSATITAVNYASGGAVSITKSYADVSERCYCKVGRWIQKLSATNVVQEYCLNKTEEIESASKKFLAMCKGLRDAIEYEWIEEYLLDIPAVDVVMHDAQQGEADNASDAAVKRRGRPPNNAPPTPQGNINSIFTILQYYRRAKASYHADAAG